MMRWSGGISSRWRQADRGMFEDEVWDHNAQGWMMKQYGMVWLGIGLVVGGIVVTSQLASHRTASKPVVVAPERMAAPQRVARDIRVEESLPKIIEVTSEEAQQAQQAQRASEAPVQEAARAAADAAGATVESFAAIELLAEPQPADPAQVSQEPTAIPEQPTL